MNIKWEIKMAYERVSELTYIGADDVSALGAKQIIRKFKTESNLLNPIDMIDDLEGADGFNGWTVNRPADNVVVHTSTWDSEAQHDAWKAGWGEIIPGDDWTLTALETAS
jgi:hypothetical protein